ncbi:MAG: stage II sporulation protein M [Candidatus Cloacimonetes bacterium]|nr:stage II sporulation protein M [Candidatus Cloacimonadota bacterium]
MIINLEKFISTEQRYWEKLEGFLNKLDDGSIEKLNFEQVKELQYLYQKCSAALSQVQGFSADSEIKIYLENLVARAFTRIYSGKRIKKKINVFEWFFYTFPQTFRKHYRAFLISLIITLVASLFGVLAVYFDSEAKSIVMPFSHLQGDPSERVQKEESATKDNIENLKTTFSAQLMTHNIRVSFFTFALGITWGFGTIIMLFYNGIILGAVCLDYVIAGETRFLIAWLLPHGSIEIPAILLAGQAGFILAFAMIGWGNRTKLKDRLKEILPDLTTILIGIMIMLVWAGIIEAFVSQYHEPKLPYSVKIIFGSIQLLALIAFLSFSGRKKSSE